MLLCDVCCVHVMLLGSCLYGEYRNFIVFSIAYHIFCHLLLVVLCSRFREVKVLCGSYSRTDYVFTWRLIAST